MKYRISELGFKQVDGIDNYIDEKYIKDYSFAEAKTSNSKLYRYFSYLVI
ncbi:MAG: hypothetical protein HUJ61_01030 [Bacilli bacterium]|nr:hypothetical protein [Bacilli bacterium]